MGIENQPKQEKDKLSRRGFLMKMTALSLGAVFSADSSEATTFGFDVETYVKQAERRLLEIEAELVSVKADWEKNGCGIENDLSQDCQKIFSKLKELLGEKAIIQSALKNFKK